MQQDAQLARASGEKGGRGEQRRGRETEGGLDEERELQVARVAEATGVGRREPHAGVGSQATEPGGQQVGARVRGQGMISGGRELEGSGRGERKERQRGGDRGGKQRWRQGGSGGRMGNRQQ